MLFSLYGRNARLPASLYAEDIVFSGTATASVSLRTSGLISTNSSIDFWRWRTKGVLSSHFEAIAVVTSGTLSSGVTVWTPITSNLTWTASTSTGPKSVLFDLKIRPVGMAKVLAVAAVELWASYEGV